MAVGRGSILRASNANAATKEKSEKKKMDGSAKKEVGENEIIQNIVNEASGKVPISVIKEVPKVWGLPKFNEDSNKAVTDSVKKFGILVPLVTYRNEKQEVVLLKGYNRLAAAKAAGLGEVPVTFVEVADEKQAKKIYEEIRRFDYVEKKEGYEVVSSITVNMPSYLL